MRSRTSRTRTGAALAVAAVLSATLVPVAASPATAASCDSSASSRPPGGGVQERDAVLCLVNAERTGRGLPALTVNQSLTDAARQHTAAAVQLKWWGPWKDSHTNPQTRSTPQSRIMGAGYCPNPRSWGVSEITYNGWGGAGTPASAVKWWMNSPGHRAIILDSSLREFGGGAQAGAADPAGAGASGAGTYVVTFGRCQR
ncbi:CAP domain-containing protein [Streptomyces sp. NBC_00091]|uniref:CAP domain-containing protein n=1 Tax=Streptomyces sp. NBC_00091 TaxID=2975648 RepID=UPI0022517978|nr:CAP domain-containing protein [Streptomyces sp. NBC_00091]MCX5380527.1 CAP domain-containing protein [Streptomyces sp. NBC_00091]